MSWKTELKWTWWDIQDDFLTIKDKLLDIVIPGHKAKRENEEERKKAERESVERKKAGQNCQIEKKQREEMKKYRGPDKELTKAAIVLNLGRQKERD